MVGIAIASLFALQSANVDLPANDPDRFLSVLEVSAKTARDVKADTLSPNLTADQIVTLRKIKDCSWSANYSSTAAKRVFSWSCGERGQKGHLMKIHVRDGSMQLLLLDEQVVWQEES